MVPIEERQIPDCGFKWGDEQPNRDRHDEVNHHEQCGVESALSNPSGDKQGYPCRVPEHSTPPPIKGLNKTGVQRAWEPILGLVATSGRARRVQTVSQMRTVTDHPSPSSLAPAGGLRRRQCVYRQRTSCITAAGRRSSPGSRWL